MIRPPTAGRAAIVDDMKAFLMDNATCQDAADQARTRASADLGRPPANDTSSHE